MSEPLRRLTAPSGPGGFAIWLVTTPASLGILPESVTVLEVDTHASFTFAATNGGGGAIVAISGAVVVTAFVQVDPG